jgi:hypothetical protein
MAKQKTQSARQETGAPTTKVMSGTVGAALASLVIWALQAFNVAVPDGTQIAITTVVTFMFGYYTPPAQRDVVGAA